MHDEDLLYLNKEDLERLDLSWQEIFDVVEIALSEKGRKLVDNPAKIGVYTTDDAFIHAMPSYLMESKAVGMKWAGAYPGNRLRDIDTVSGLQINNSDETGFPIAIMNAAWITKMRTVAVSALSCRHLAKENTEVMGIIGAGVQGQIHAEVLPQVLKNLKTIDVFDLDEEKSKILKKKVEEKWNINVKIQKTAQETVCDADLVITALTRPAQYIVEYPWIKNGALCMPLENSRAWQDEAPFKVNKFITDDLAQAKNYHKKGSFPLGIPSLYAETGEIIAGLKHGRENEDEKIMVMNIGVACTDIAFGQLLYAKAKEQSIGTHLRL